MPDIFSAGAGLVSGLISGIAGIGQRNKAKKALNQLQYPTEQLPEELTRNQNMAEQMAGQGLPSEQYNQAMKNIERQQLMALNNAHNRRSGLIGLGGIQQRGDDALLNLDVANSQQRIANQRNLMSVNSQVAGVKRDLFDKNVRDKYNRDYGYNMSLLGSGNQNLFGGIDKGVAGLGGILSGLFGSGKKNKNYSDQEPALHV